MEMGWEARGGGGYIKSQRNDSLMIVIVLGKLGVRNGGCGVAVVEASS